MNTLDLIRKKPDDNSSPGETGDIIQESRFAIKQSFDELPLTIDQKIEKLTDQVGNLTLGLNQMIKLSTTLMKNQIETGDSISRFTQSIENFIQLTNNNLSSIDKQETNNSEMLDTLIRIEKDKANTQKLISKFKDYLPSSTSEYYTALYSLVAIVQTTKNINSVNDEGHTLLDLAIFLSENGHGSKLLSFVLTFPNVHVEFSMIKNTSSQDVKDILQQFYTNKK